MLWEKGSLHFPLDERCMKSPPLGIKALPMWHIVLPTPGPRGWLGGQHSEVVLGDRQHQGGAGCWAALLRCWLGNAVQEVPAAGSAAEPASPDCFSPATSQVALLKLQVDLMEGN